MLRFSPRMSIWNKHMHICIHTHTDTHTHSCMHTIRVSEQKNSIHIYNSVRVNHMTRTIKQSVKAETSNSKYCLFKK